MNKPEYIEFNFTIKEQLQAFVQLFDKIKDIRSNEKEYEIIPLLALVPENVLDFFTEEDRVGGWKIQNLIQFLIDDLDVSYLTVFEKDHNIGRLEFESNGYPYGGPDSLIILLRSFGLMPFEVDEGADIYRIRWTSDYEFTFQSINHQQLNQKKITLKARSPWWKFW
jgi:hypothetical protein